MKKMVKTILTKVNKSIGGASQPLEPLEPFKPFKPFKPAFTLVEMLVVIGIIAVLIGASVAGFSKMTKSAEKAKCQELVSNVATALTAMFQQEGVWPKRLAAQGKTDGKLDAQTAYALVAGQTAYFSLTKKGNQLAGNDRFGIVTPWAAAAIKRAGASASLGTAVGSMTVDDHILHYALDLDGDGKILGASVGGQAVDIRATAAVWCGGKDGVISPYPYAGGGKGGGKCDDVWSWTPRQTKDVQ